MKLNIKTLSIIAAMVLVLAAFVWLLTTRGPLAPVGVQSDAVVRVDLRPSVFGIGTVEHASPMRLAQPSQGGCCGCWWIRVTR